MSLASRRASVLFELAADLQCYYAAEFNRHRIAQLTHVLAPSASEGVLVGKGLHPGGFTNRQVANTSIVECDHVLAAWDTVIARLQCLRGFVDRGTRVSGILARSWLEDMVCDVVPD